MTESNNNPQRDRSVPQPFDLASAADTVTAIAAYDPGSARCQQYGPDYFMSETDLTAYLREAGASPVVYDLNRSTGQWIRRAEQGMYADKERAHVAALATEANRTARIQPVEDGYEEPFVVVAGLQTGTFASDEGQLVVDVDTSGIKPLFDWPNNPEVVLNVDGETVWRGKAASQQRYGYVEWATFDQTAAGKWRFQLADTVTDLHAAWTAAVDDFAEDRAAFTYAVDHSDMLVEHHLVEHFPQILARHGLTYIPEPEPAVPTITAAVDNILVEADQRCSVLDYDDQLRCGALLDDAGQCSRNPMEHHRDID